MAAIFAAIVVAAAVTVSANLQSDNQSDANVTMSPEPSPSPTAYDLTPPPPPDILAYVPETICYDRFPGQGRSRLCSINATASRGGGVCNIVAKSLLLTPPNTFRDMMRRRADISIQHAGACRTDIEEGNFTMADARRILPFDHDVATVDLTGRQLKLTLEQAISFALDNPNDPRTEAYPYASGLRFKLDLSLEEGNRFYDIEVNSHSDESSTWTPLQMDDIYVVVTNSHLARRNFDYFLNVSDENITMTNVNYRSEFVAWVKQEQILEDLPQEEYSTQFFTQ